MDKDQQQRHFSLDSPFEDIVLGNTKRLVVIAGPCVMEGLDFCLKTADHLKTIFEKFDIDFIYKSSYDKANRTSIKSFRGVGLEGGLKIISSIKEKIGIPVLTDVHTAEQAKQVSYVADMLQTPAFLCRQTDFIQAVAETKKPINIKKGQFLAPLEMQQVLEKARNMGNDRIALCERGTMFGYSNLVVDMRSLAIMSNTGFPVVFDATHSVQQPGILGNKSGGQREFVHTLSKAAVAVGISAVFIETHPDPSIAPCDGPNMISFAELPNLVHMLKEIDYLVKFHNSNS